MEHLGYAYFSTSDILHPHVWWPPHTKKQTSPSGSRTSSGHCPTSARGKRAEEWEDYPLVNVDITNWKIILRVPGKLEITGYLLVMTNIAIENSHRNSELSHMVKTDSLDMG